VDAHQGSIYDLSFLGRDFDVVVCAEVMEHLDDPAAALEQIIERRPSWVILSVPHEPWFCLSNFARGKNITRFGNDPEHVNPERMAEEQKGSSLEPTLTVGAGE
jgi:SAM-dependent methyltransferase